VDPPSLPSAIVEYPPDLMDSHDPDRHREVDAEERDLGGVFVDEDNDQQDE
jgi:hypothetical protein